VAGRPVSRIVDTDAAIRAIRAGSSVCAYARAAGIPESSVRAALKRIGFTMLPAPTPVATLADCNRALAAATEVQARAATVQAVAETRTAEATERQARAYEQIAGLLRDVPAVDRFAELDVLIFGAAAAGAVHALAAAREAQQDYQARMAVLSEQTRAAGGHTPDRCQDEKTGRYYESELVQLSKGLAAAVQAERGALEMYRLSRGLSASISDGRRGKTTMIHAEGDVHVDGGGKGEPLPVAPVSPEEIAKAARFLPDEQRAALLEQFESAVRALRKAGEKKGKGGSAG